MVYQQLPEEEIHNPVYLDLGQDATFSLDANLLQMAYSRKPDKSKETK